MIKDAYKVISDKNGVSIEGNGYSFSLGGWEKDGRFLDRKSQINLAVFMVEKMNKAYRIGITRGLSSSVEIRHI